MEPPSNEDIQTLRNDLVMMAEAAVSACVEDLPNISPVGVGLANAYAEMLSRRTTVYAVSEDREEIQALSASDLEGGLFTEGGSEMTFSDGRPTLRGLAVRRSELKPAIEALKRASAAPKGR